MLTVLAVLAGARLAYEGLKPWRFYIAGWRAVPQMIDSLALGETTSGPLIMVVFGPDSLLLAGAVAAPLVTWLTFLPSFVFILMGGPFIETTHAKGLRGHIKPVQCLKLSQ